MPTRLLREGINSSHKINSLTSGAELLYRRLLSVVDDYGRFYAAPSTVRGACWPGHPDNVTEDQIKCWLEECAEDPEPLIVRYQVGRVWFLQVDKFGQKIRSKSKFPSPDGIQEYKPGEGSVYFIRSFNLGRIKIGFTELTPIARLATLQTGSAEPLELIGSFPGSMADEKNAHQILSIHRIAGEWFNASADVLSFIADKCGIVPHTVSEMRHVAEKMPQNAGTSRSRSRISESKTESYKAADAEKETIEPSFESTLDATTERIHARHPAVRSCGPKEVKTKLRAIVKRHATDELDSRAVLEIVDKNHAIECVSEQWTQKGGEFAKGLGNWLAPTEDRYMGAKPTESQGSFYAYPPVPKYEKPVDADDIHT